jgi:hypothetical protein
VDTGRGFVLDKTGCLNKLKVKAVLIALSNLTGEGISVSNLNYYY